MIRISVSLIQKIIMIQFKGQRDEISTGVFAPNDFEEDVLQK